MWVQSGYLRPDQFLDHLTVIITTIRLLFEIFVKKERQNANVGVILQISGEVTHPQIFTTSGSAVAVSIEVFPLCPPDIAWSVRLGEIPTKGKSDQNKKCNFAK